MTERAPGPNGPTNTNGNGQGAATGRAGQPRRKPKSRAAPPADFWRAVPEPAEPGSIRPADDPLALLRSLGTPPLAGQAAVAEHYLGAVIERAASLATALAAAAGLLDESEH